jgi:uncharacterized sulfatase
MRKKAWIGALFAGVVLTVMGAERPNFVFIMADDCTFSDIGCYGGQAKTPNIDALAKEGMRFTRCFQAAPMCSPTRHNIYTGLYPVKSGAYPNHTFAKEGTQSIVHYLKELDYHVALSGKTHIKPESVFPFEYTKARGGPDMNAIDKLFGESVKNSTPFCLFAMSTEPHTPWTRGDASAYPPEKIKLPPYIADTPLVRQEFAKYLAEITFYDDQVGQILGLIDKHGLRDNTMVMVVSEQGNAFPFAKWTCYDMGLQSVMIVRWPGHIEADSVSDAIVEYTDVTSTFVDAAGGTPSPVLDGKSFLPVLQGTANQHKEYSYGLMTTRGIISGSDCYPIRSVRDKQFRFIWNLNHKEAFRNVAMNQDVFKSMLATAEAGDKRAQRVTNNYQNRPEFELYGVTKDPLNQNNLADKPEYAEAIKRLKGKLDAWMAEQGDKGIETELDADNHQGSGLKKKGKSAKKKKK